jgi:tRNA modification GTPase
LAESPAPNTRDLTDTAILLTPAGIGAIAVVRLVGNDVGEFLSRHFDRQPRALHCVYGTIRDGDRVIDDAVIVLVDERLADVNLHGGVWVVQQFMDLARREGFVICDSLRNAPSEAFDSDDEIEREMLAAIPRARTELALRVLTSQPSLWKSLDHANAKAMLEDRALWWLLGPPRVAIVGAPNVGKSTLANQLFGQNRSITADLPGTTRDWVGESADLDGLMVTLVDTPGVRETADPIEREAIDRSGKVVKTADLVVLVLDASRALQPEEGNLMRSFPTALIVENKSDLPRRVERSDGNAIKVVATRGDGVDDLRHAIRVRFGIEGLVESVPRCWTPRQITWLMQRARNSPG